MAYGTLHALTRGVLALFIIVTLGGGRLLFVLVNLAGHLRESQSHRVRHNEDPEERSLTLVMLERYRARSTQHDFPQPRYRIALFLLG